METRAWLKTIGMVLAGWVLLAGTGWAEEVKTIRILPDIWTVHPTGGTDANATFIATEQGVLVVDTRRSAKGGQHVLDEIRKKTNKPITHVINTHHHKESVLGNAAFKNCPSIIAHRQAQKNLEKLVEDGALKEDDVIYPNLVFDTHAELTLGGYMLQLRHPGPAHTNGDVYVYLPSWRTIIAGGLVFNEVLPDTDDSYIDPWIDALQEMEDLDAELIVPGHGKPGGKQIIIQAKHYLLLLKRYVNYQLDEGRTLNETIHHVTGILKDKYGHWKHPERMVDNIRRAYIEYSAKRGT